MLQNLLRYTSIVVSAIVVLSFVFFAVDQSKSSSAQEVATVGNETSSTAVQAQTQQPVAPKPKAHGQPRAAIDDADKQILKPFDGLANSSGSAWAKKGIPSLLALFVFGFLLNLLAGYLPKPKPAEVQQYQ
jgi:hypothetical protein